MPADPRQEAPTHCAAHDRFWPTCIYCLRREALDQRDRLRVALERVRRAAMDADQYATVQELADDVLGIVDGTFDESGADA